MKERKEKLTKEQKRKKRQQKYEELENKKGISKFWSTLIFETLYIFITEICFKLMLGSLTFDYTLLRIFLSSTILSLLLCIITTNLHSKVRKVIILSFNFIIVFYAWLQLGFNDYLGAFMSIGNAEQGTKITSYVLDFLVSYDLHIHLIYSIFIASLVYYYFERYITRDGYNKKINFKNWINNTILVISLILLCCTFYLTISLDFMQNKYQTISNKSLIIYPSSPALAIKNYGTSVYLLLDLKSTIIGGAEDVFAVSKKEEKEESTTRIIDDTAWEELIANETNDTLNILNNYFINRKITETNEYTGLFEGKNVIVIMLESIGSAVFSEEYKEYFPTLYKLYNEGITFTNNYSPRNNCATGESEMTSQIGLYSISTTCTVNTYKKNYYPEALMSLLKKNGYYTSAYHDYTDQYYSRSVYEKNLGSIDYYGVTKLGMKYSSLYKEWPSDVTFMEKALPKFTDKEKFASYMITVTAHQPYMYNSEFGNMYYNMFDDLAITKNTKRYLSKVKVDDLALEYLFTNLEENGLLEDTVIVLFGDHYPYGLSDSEYQSIASYDTSINQEVDRTPFIIYNSSTESKKVTKYTSPMDIAPTLLNLLGIDYDPRHYLGNDVFSDYDDFVLFPDNSWQNALGFYSASRGKFTPNEGTDEIMSDEEIIKMNNQVHDLRNMSGLAIKKNYFKYLFEYFEEYKEKQKELTETDDIAESSDKEMEE